MTMSKIFRHPRTFQEAAFAELHRIEGSEFGIKIRAKRTYKHLPSAWDDLYPSTINDRCWKGLRKEQYRPVMMIA